MAGWLATVAVGLVSGVLSGAFGIGGGLVTTPAIRLLLGYPALVAVGTPLPVIVPGALTGALSYGRRGLADVRAGVFMGLVGTIGSVAGALLSAKAGGTFVLLATAVLIAYASADMLLQQRRESSRSAATRNLADAARPVAAGEGESDEGLGTADPTRPGVPGLARLAMIGAIAGLYSGFLGLGGGFVIVPGLTRFCGMPVKRAIGTSLVTVAVLAIPGTIVHNMLGHIDWRLAVLLAIGVIPGAMIGARLTGRASDRLVRLSFAAMLAVVGVWLAVSEILAGMRP
jgi:uncharacterized membrane protein YfcA